MPLNTELDALLSRVREDKSDTTGKNRNAVAYDCWRMFEDLATRYKKKEKPWDMEHSIQKRIGHSLIQ